MTLTPLSPGVYVTEVPSGSRTVTGVATSLAAFVGPARRGPVDTPVDISSFADFERVFGGLSRDCGLGYAVWDFYLNGGGPAIVVRVHHEATCAVLPVGELTLTAIGPGTWANDLRVVVEHPDPAEIDDVATSQGVDAADLFTLIVYDGTGPDAPSETYYNVTMVDGPRRVDHVLTASQLVRVTGRGEERPEATNRDALYVVGTEGDDGTTLDAGDYTATGRGLSSLDGVDLFTILCLPPPSPDGELPAAVWADAAAYCVKRRAFLIVDPPPGLAVDAAPGWPATTGLSGVAARNAAVYYPRIRRPDRLRGGAVGTFAACGAIAGVMARTDAARGVWKAPAGIEAGLSGVTALEHTLTEADNARLNPKGVNALRWFRDVGPVIWGARTLRGADVLSDDYKYVPVRRLALYLEESLYRGTQWVVFEPNDEPLWAQIRLSLGAFMQDLFRKGAFQGLTPKDAYFVRCDATTTTTTQHDIDRGIVNIHVGFAPLKPAEFVLISIQQKTAAASV